jgi:hypothetical protein
MTGKTSWIERQRWERACGRGELSSFLVVLTVLACAFGVAALIMWSTRGFQ